ncbi:DHA1 family bicyclomycin/chloramphenicol resistance-like MFS transporter [Lipingzhangella halophila]|uniref:DHA1 family bicyclomycin/chloramphenicol resistance-like MFS transporter n=1 Tax=Lipingzhangella halophila TaxID=1783352 RepID=A0A7W7RFI2_9ACTN|nr:DHA1 family bicyclomycin/chloramphenicol resistance-like MFS transporter [Lipingzhangella halophila]
MSLVSARPRLTSRPAAEAGQARTPRRSVVLLVFVLGVLSATSSLATDLYLPAFPDIAADLNATESQIQLTLTAVMVGLALGQLVIGPLSDRWGRRRPLLVGTAMFALSSLLCMTVTSPEMFSALRFVQGIAAAAGMVIARAVVRDTFSGDAAAKFFSRLVLLVGLAPMLGPILGGQLMLIGPWQLIFAVLGVAGLAGTGLVYFGLPETLAPQDRTRRDPVLMLRTFGRLLRDPRFIAPSMTMALSFAMTFTYISAFSFVSQEELGATAQQFSLVFGINTLGMILGNQVNVALISRMHTSRRLFVGLIGATLSIVALGILGLSGTAGLIEVTVVLFVMMLCTGLISPNATTLAVASQPSSLGGTSSALLGTMQFAIGGILASAAGLTSTGEATLTSMTLVMLATAVTATAVFGIATARGHTETAA